jgi:predicted transcriptional regulator
MLLDLVNQNVQEAIQKFKDNKNKEYEKTQKQINELIGVHKSTPSETESTIEK